MTVFAASRSRSEWTNNARSCAEWSHCPKFRQRRLRPKLQMSTESICKPNFDCSRHSKRMSCLTQSFTGTPWCRILDNLPVAISQIRDDSGSDVKRYERGFPIGRVEVGICFSA